MSFFTKFISTFILSIKCNPNSKVYNWKKNIFETITVPVKVTVPVPIPVQFEPASAAWTGGPGP